MNNFEIRINIKTLASYSSALRRDIGEEKFNRLVLSYAKYLRNIYLGMIEESIYNTKYEGQWEPSSDEAYQKYLGTTPVKNTVELLSSSIEIVKSGYTIAIRINPNLKYPGSNLSIVQVIKSLEYGTSKFNARPIFRTILRKMQGNILSLWRSYLTKKGII